jgi:molecular chaperone GrpE
MTSHPENKPEALETLSERNARLEAEATEILKAPAFDPLAPEPLAADTSEALKIELEQAKDQMMRALADAENTRRRAVKEREDAGKYAVTSFAKDMIDVADNLRRALESVPVDLMESEPRLKNLIGGIEATERTLLKSFEKQGIRKIQPLEEIFNPNYHEVMFEASVPGKPAGTIMQVLEAGYLLHDRLIRPARVGVVKDDGQGSGPAHPGGKIDTSA